VLGDGGGGSFTTPFATLHKFNGWADLFLATPQDGLRDAFVSAGATVAGVKLSLVYHDFSADTGGARYGDELDGSVVWNASWKQQFALKFALYNADEFRVDTNKIWIWTRWGF
jgi:hypothetical protein